MTSTWIELALDKKRRQQESIPKDWLIDLPASNVLDITNVPETCGLLTDRELEITRTTDVEALLHKLASAEWSAVEVTTAFYKRAIIAQQLTNCLTEIFVERALDRARELDDHLKKTGKPIGSLHGLPVSLKDQLCIQGLETTMGYASWVGKDADKNAVLVDILYEAGAVPFVRTNVPQTLMWAETFNNVFGRTVNPHNRSLTSGGSSGGEGALIALKGSPLGVGSDIGGSVRIPAACCGLYGLRPSYHRVPYAGAVNSLEGQDGVSSVFGPMSNNLNGIKAFMRAVAESKPWTRDPLVIRKPWDEDAYRLAEHGNGERMCFGIMWHDGSVVPHPPITRGLQIAKEALIAAGHTVIDWKPFKMPELSRNLQAIWAAGGDEDYQSTVASTGEPIIADMTPDKEYSSEPSSQDGISAYALWQLHKERRSLRQEYLQAWNATAQITETGRPIDALLCPTAPYVAPPHGKYTTVIYTNVWNTLDYPAIVIPVSKVDPAKDFQRFRMDFMSATDKSHYDIYNPNTYENAPVSVQIVGQTLEEEAVIGMAEIVDSAVKELKASNAKL